MSKLAINAMKSEKLFYNTSDEQHFYFPLYELSYYKSRSRGNEMRWGSCKRDRLDGNENIKALSNYL